MQVKPVLIEFAAAVWHKLEPFLPGILGAAVAQMMRPGLGMRQRFIQWPAIRRSPNPHPPCLWRRRMTPSAWTSFATIGARP